MLRLFSVLYKNEKHEKKPVKHRGSECKFFESDVLSYTYIQVNFYFGQNDIALLRKLLYNALLSIFVVMGLMIFLLVIYH